MSRQNIKQIIKEYLGIAAGTVITALGLDLFLIPNQIAAGGLSGLATIIFYLTDIPVGVLMLLLNIPLFLAAFNCLGFKMIIRSLVGTVLLSVAVDGLGTWLQVPTQDPLLAGLYGGALSGIGLGLVFRCQGTTGGTDLAAVLCRHYLGINVGQALFLVDAMVIVAAGIVFELEAALYALLAVLVTSWLIDIVQDGISYVREVTIITACGAQMLEAIMVQMGRGATVLTGSGGYTGQEKSVIITVVNRSEVARLKKVIYANDGQAFVILHTVHEVFGEGFKRINK